MDASMRELAATGWMSNRGRQNVANVLSKVGGWARVMGLEVVGAGQTLSPCDAPAPRLVLQLQ